VLLVFEEKNGHLPQVKINKVFGLMCDVTPKVSSHDTVPCRIILLVKLLAYLFNIGCNVLFNVVLLHGLGGTIHCILLHVLRHVCILDHSFSIRHMSNIVGIWPF
uniref:Dynein light chain n=1 Tax=Erpetoichthys calabaricus TaxID=27687 RepID=A0A8C4S0H0_ERPCA